MMRTTLAAALAAALLLPAGGGAATDRAPIESSPAGDAPRQRFQDPRKAALAQARARWKKHGFGGTYRFRLDVMCFCVGTGKASTITVRRGRASGSDGAENAVDTVPKMFRLIAEALDDPNAGEVDVRYDPKRGFPRAAAIDRIEMAMDDEISWSADRMRRLGR